MSRAADSAFRLAVVPGDQDSAEQLVEIVLQRLRSTGLEISTETYDLGTRRYLGSGQVLTAQDVAAFRDSDAVLVASAIGGTDHVPVGLLERGVVFGLRKALNLAVNIRIFEDGDRSIGRRVAVVREVSEGLYMSEPNVVHPGTNEAVAVESSVATRSSALRAVEVAFKLAEQWASELVLVHKRAVLLGSGSVWTEALGAAQKDHPDVQTSYCNIDTFCGDVVRGSVASKVVVTDNVFGDIAADVVCAALGSEEYAGSAELALGAGPSLFEPLHGIPVRRKVRPILGTVALLLAANGWEALGGSLWMAVREVTDVPSMSDREYVDAVMDRCSETSTSPSDVPLLALRTL